MSNVPAVVEQTRQEIAEAQQSGDIARANELYQAELAALSGAADGATGESVSPHPGSPALPVAPAENVENILVALDYLEPENAAELRRHWPGGEMAKNLGAVGWLDSKYSLPAAESEAQFLAAAVSLARQVYTELLPDAAPPAPLAQEVVDAVLAEYGDETASTLRYARATQLPQDLAFVSWLLQRYGAGVVPDSEVATLRLKSAIARGVHADLQEARRTPAGRQSATEGNSEVQNMTEDEYDEALDLLREEQQKQQALGNSRRANRAYRQEQELIAARLGNRPVVGSGQRYA